MSGAKYTPIRTPEERIQELERQNIDNQRRNQNLERALREGQAEMKRLTQATNEELRRREALHNNVVNRLTSDIKQIEIANQQKLEQQRKAFEKVMADRNREVAEDIKQIEKDNKERLGKRLDMEVFNRSDKGRIHTNFYIYSERYWDGTVKMTLFDINKLNENYTKLYEKFPGLKEDIDTLKKKGQTAELNIILTGNPSYEEIAKLVSEEGKELPFDDVWVGAKYSVDGSVHLINNFDEWRKYYRIDEKDVSMLSPIFPRQLK